MAPTNIIEILSELGWHDGFRIPVANDKNKHLEEKIEEKMKLKETLTGKLGSAEERVKMMKKHTSNLATQCNTNQKLLNTHSAHLETENHYYRLSRNIESNIRQEARNFEKKWKEMNEVISNKEEVLMKMMKKVEASKIAVKFDKISIQKWEDILDQNEENNQLIEKYMKGDAKAFKELEIKRQNLRTQLENYRQAITKVTDEAREMAVILDHTTKLHNQALKERQQIFNQWKESVVMLQQREDDIEKSFLETETLREIFETKKTVVWESEKFLKDQIGANKRLQYTIKELENKLSEIRTEHAKIKDMVNIYETKLCMQRNIVKDLAQNTQKIHGDIKCKEIKVDNTYIKIEEVKKQITNLTAKLNNINNQKFNLEDRTKELEKIIEEQEKRKSTMIKEVNRLQVADLHITNQIKKLQNEKKVIDMQCQNAYKKVELLNLLYPKEEKVLDEKKETLYLVEFELQKLEMKLERLRGHEYNKSEVQGKEKRIEELESALNEKMKISKLLQKQTANLEHQMKKMSSGLTHDNNELQHLRSKQQDLMLLMNGGEKQLKAAQARNEGKQVEENILRLRVLQVEKMISNFGNSVYNLEKYRSELDAAIRERKVEIFVQKESLIIQTRVTTSECSQLRNAITERKARIRQLHARYENGVAAFTSEPGDTTINTAHLKIQTTQERLFVQEEGDKLDETIRKTEQEIQSMENTLRVINACNDKYKVCFTMISQNNPEQEEQSRLTEELWSMEQNMKQKQEKLQYSMKNFQKIQNDYDQILKDVKNTTGSKEDKERYLSDLRKQINEQKEKLLRADKNLHSAQKDIKQMYHSTGGKVVILQEKEVELRDIQEQNIMVLNDIAEFTIRHVEADAYIKKLLSAKNVELPIIALFNTSPRPNHYSSVTNSVEYLPKSTSRTSVFTSSQEIIQSVINIEHPFERTFFYHV